MGLYPIILALPLWLQNNQISAKLVAYQSLADTKCEEYEERIESLEDSLLVFRGSLDSLWKLHPYLNEESLIKLSSFIDKYKYCPGTKFVVKEQVNPEMEPALYKALSTYQGPPATITSMYRPRSYGSDHRDKLAVDIRWNESGKLMAEWLITEDGVQ